MFELLPEQDGKRGPGRPRLHGKRLKTQDFELVPVAGTEYQVGCRMVTTRVFGKTVVSAIVTSKGESGSRRLFFCTRPEACREFLAHPYVFPEGDARNFAAADPQFLPLSVYFLRWTIETSYLELKSFWDFGDYKVRSKDGVERLLNLQSLVYSILSLLPALDDDFACLDGMSIQERRWHVEQLISRQIFFTTLVQRLESDKMYQPLLKTCRDLMEQDRLAA